jgi:hypothetical protein
MRSRRLSEHALLILSGLLLMVVVVAGRLVRPVNSYAAILEDILKAPDIITEPLNIAADLINRYPDRILFGTVTKDESLKVRKANYENIFDEAVKRLRNWEARHLPAAAQVLPVAR